MNLWYMRFALLSLLLFSAVVTLIRAQPYNLDDLRRSLLDEDCSGACFLGIRPGVTSVDEALARLQASDWVGQIDNRTINNVTGFIEWTWSQHAPRWIATESDGKIWATQKQIISIYIISRLQLGDSRLVLGLPDQEEIDRNQDRKGIYSLYSAFYAQAGLMVQSWQPCNVLEPLRRQAMFTYIVQSDPKNFPPRDSLYDLRHTCAVPRP